MADQVRGTLNLLGKVDPDAQIDGLIASAATLANDTLAMIPEGAQRLPHSTMRTVWGAEFYHDYPEFTTRQWLTHAHQHLSEYHHHRGTWKKLTRWFR